MRDRLVELLRKVDENPTITCPRCNADVGLDACNGCQYDKEDGSCDYTSRAADYLLANGVIVPPCKVGDIVYATKGCFYLPHATQIKEDSIITCEIIAVKETKKGKFLLLKPLIEEAFNMRSSNGWFPFSSIGKTIFLTKEAAKQAIAKIKDGAEE